MLDLAEAVKAEPPRVLPKSAAAKSAAAKRAEANSAEAKKTFTMAGLRRLTVWGATAAGALLIAALTSRSPVGVQRMAAVLHHGGGLAQVATRSSDATAETQRLAEAVRGLSASDEQIKTRLAAVEHDMDDVTGSITKQIEAANAAQHSEAGPSVAATAATAAIVPPVAMPQAVTAAPPDTTPPAEAAGPALPRTEYGVDIGSGLTIEALRARWTTIRTAHPQLFAGLEPIVSVKEVPHANRVELRLVAGPFAEAAAATKLCASLALVGLFCQPTIFDGQHLAAR